ncbi:hypothetical protein EK21DRAFT_110042 [Setomelanomma holmii]|uniref:DUF7702 domain-containing protein n=1 Tax=Setomelanomma holmii TaxID=210430 RepID=A0A9P4HE49_9PLEO|nr:hypothetical protein EK21DRAFT_110042 [Setomelanomma holmii]
MVHARDVVAGVELAFYIPTSILAIIICVRHGFHRSSGWIFTLILCTVRIAGAICQFISHNNQSTGLITATIIIDSIGLSPLLLATLGILSRFVDFINSRAAPIFTVKHFRLLQLLITVGLILSIVGGTSSNIQPNGHIEVETTSKVGIILYIIAYVGLALVFAISIPRLHVVIGKERRVAVAIVLAMPFILVRLVYSACAVFLHNHLFNMVTGSVVVLVVMDVAMEFIVVAIYILLGFAVDKVGRDNAGPIAGRT